MNQYVLPLAGHVLVEHFATMSLPLLLPAVEEGTAARCCQVYFWELSSGVICEMVNFFDVAGTSGKALLEGGSDEGASTEAHGRAIIEVAGRSLGELVRKLGERVLPLVIPIYLKG
ncbi:similar to ILITYHIA [Actinidia rufa]|uniref:Similar to ILITYHIA n=1 Tax=Actinidia rufa TaxID=165716 RepID=A0A7J0FW50_9ERIC|nr:similar to ILITYHIA [Actinidia rufa]